MDTENGPIVARVEGSWGMGEKGEGIKKYKFGPGWCGSVDWVQACEPKGQQFDSQSGHTPGLPDRSPVGGVQEATTH